MRRRVLAGVAGLLALPVFSRRAAAQLAVLDSNVTAFARGAEVRRGRVKLDLPQLAENGFSVPARISVDSPMTDRDHVKAIRLISDRNPEPVMATFYLGPHAGRADIATRVRLAGSQRVFAVAELSDGSFWLDSREIIVSISACIDDSERLEQR